MTLLLDLVLHPTFEGTPVLFVPDCAFMIDRPMDVWGAPLEIEVLLYGCLGSCSQLMELAQKGRSSRLLEQRLVLTRQWKHDLRSYLLKHYWVTSKTMQVLRRRLAAKAGSAPAETLAQLARRPGGHRQEPARLGAGEVPRRRRRAGLAPGQACGPGRRVPGWRGHRRPRWPEAGRARGHG